MAPNKILVIDDSPVIRMLIRQMIPSNIEITEAREGEEGIRLFYKERSNLSLIMLDFWLPKASGWDIFQLLETNPNSQRSVALVVMTDRREDVDRKIPKNWQSYFAILEKPFEKKELFAAIKLAVSCLPRQYGNASDRPVEEQGAIAH